ncbi:MAG: PadR family transcriptional regulator [Oscillospiraceae bacterium]|nr:PadR family transcriptional regulator [Oscillospiraceae bacterium]
MPREKFVTLTEQMFYILLCLQEECCGTDIMDRVRKITAGRVNVGPGTLYNLLEQFSEEGIIRLTKTEGKKRSYIITAKGAALLEKEYARIQQQARDYEALVKK